MMMINYQKLYSTVHRFLMYECFHCSQRIAVIFYIFLFAITAAGVVPCDTILDALTVDWGKFKSYLQPTFLEIKSKKYVNT